MTSFHIDDDELRNLEVDISGAPGRMQRDVSATVRKGSRLINKAMRQDAAGHRYLKHLPSAVSDEMIDPWTAEIGLGPKRGTQGSLAHIIVYGSVNNGPVYDHMAGPRKVLPAIERMFADAAEEAVLGGEK